jgi:hypothetical protein
MLGARARALAGAEALFIVFMRPTGSPAPYTIFTYSESKGGRDFLVARHGLLDDYVAQEGREHDLVDAQGLRVGAAALFASDL